MRRNSCGIVRKSLKNSTKARILIRGILRIRAHKSKQEVNTMQPFLPREKMCKRDRRALDASKRTTWDNINPVTRKTENKKAYNRKKSPRSYHDDSTGIFVCRCA